MKPYVIVMMCTCVLVLSVGKHQYVDGLLNTQLRKQFDEKTLNFNKTTNNTGNSVNYTYLDTYYNISQTNKQRIESQFNNSDTSLKEGHNTSIYNSFYEEGQNTNDTTVINNFVNSTAQSLLRDKETDIKNESVNIVIIQNKTQQVVQVLDLKEDNQSNSMSSIEHTPGVKVYSDRENNIVTTISLPKSSVVTPTENTLIQSPLVNKTDITEIPTESQIITNVFEQSFHRPITSVSKQQSIGETTKINENRETGIVSNHHNKIFPTSRNVTPTSISRNTGSSDKYITSSNNNILPSTESTRNGIVFSDSETNLIVSTSLNKKPTTVGNPMISSTIGSKDHSNDAISRTLKHSTPSIPDNKMVSSQHTMNSKNEASMSITSMSEIKSNIPTLKTDSTTLSMEMSASKSPTNAFTDINSFTNEIKHTNNSMSTLQKDSTTIQNLESVIPTSDKFRTTLPIEMAASESDNNLNSIYSSHISTNTVGMKGADIKRQTMSSENLTTIPYQENVIPTADTFRITSPKEIITSESENNLKSTYSTQSSASAIEMNSKDSKNVSNSQENQTTKIPEFENATQTSDTYQTTLPTELVSSKSHNNLSPFFSTDGSVKSSTVENVFSTKERLPSEAEITYIDLTTYMATKPTEKTTNTISMINSALQTTEMETTIPTTRRLETKHLKTTPVTIPKMTRTIIADKTNTTSGITNNINPTTEKLETITTGYENLISTTDIDEKPTTIGNTLSTTDIEEKPTTIGNKISKTDIEEKPTTIGKTISTTDVEEKPTKIGNKISTTDVEEKSTTIGNTLSTSTPETALTTNLKLTFVFLKTKPTVSTPYRTKTTTNTRATANKTIPSKSRATTTSKTTFATSIKTSFRTIPTLMAKTLQSKTKTTVLPSQAKLKPTSSSVSPTRTTRQQSKGERTSTNFKNITWPFKATTKTSTKRVLKFTNSVNTKFVPKALETTNTKTILRTTSEFQTINPSETQSFVQTTEKVVKTTNVARPFISHMKNLTTEISGHLNAKEKNETSENSVLTTTSGSVPKHDTLKVESGDDTYWPLVLALAVGIPTIIVIGVTICVIHNRRLARPSRSRFRRSRLA